MPRPLPQASPRSALVGLFIVYFAAGVAFSIIFPLGEGPDEPAHFAYVQFVTNSRALPVMRPQLSDNDTAEAFQAPGYYLLAALVTHPFAHGEAELGQNPAFSFTDRQLPVPAFYSLPAHSFPWKTPYLGWHLARCFSLTLGGLSLWLTYRAARLALRGRWPPVAAVAFLALNPQFIYLHSIVSNDALATTAGSLIAYTALLVLHRPHARHFVLAGASVAVAALAKPSALLLLPGLFYALVRSWPFLDRDRTRLPAALSVLVIPSVASAWWYIRNLSLYGDLTGMSVAKQALAVNYYPEPLAFRTYLSMLPDMFWQTWQSTWGLFGWLSFALPNWVYVALLTVHLIAAVGLVGLLSRPRPPWPLVVTSALSLGTAMAGFLYYNIETNPSGWHSRFLFPTMAILAVGAVAGWRWLLRQHDAILAGVISVGGIALLAGATGTVILPAYLPPSTVPVGSPVPNRVHARYEQALELVGYELVPQKTRPGDPVRLTLYWRVGPGGYGYRFEVDALAPDGTLVVPKSTLYTPLRYPVQAWPQDRLVVQVEEVPTSATAHQVAGHVRLYVFEGGRAPRSVRVIGDKGRPVSDHVRLGQIGVARHEEPAKPTTRPLARFGEDEIMLLGLEELRRSARPGDVISVSLRWRALRQPVADYQVFVQCTDQSGQLVTQHDGPPRMGLYPTSAWSPGEVVLDTHPVLIPETYEGGLQLIVGLYRLDSMERLPVVDAQGTQHPGRALPLGGIVIE